MRFTSQIDTYVLRFSGRSYSDTDSIAMLVLYDQNKKHIGIVRFYKDGQTIPNNSLDHVSEPKRAFLAMHERQLDGVVDMLRNEKPCFLYYLNAVNASLHTGTDLVGEEENNRSLSYPF